MSEEIEKFFDDLAMTSAAELAALNPRWLGKFAAETAIKSDKLKKENEFLLGRIEQLEAELAAERERVADLRAALKPFLTKVQEPFNIDEYDFIMVRPADIREAQVVLGEDNA